jgi:hypothetical protein
MGRAWASALAERRYMLFQWLEEGVQGRDWVIRRLG